eukprot:11669452-Karenia_brevis.AAC.1
MHGKCVSSGQPWASVVITLHSLPTSTHGGMETSCQSIGYIKRTRVALTRFPGLYCTSSGFRKSVTLDGVL